MAPSVEIRLTKRIVVEKTSTALKMFEFVFFPSLCLFEVGLKFSRCAGTHSCCRHSVPAWRLKYSAPETGEAYQIWWQWATNVCPVRSLTQHKGLVESAYWKPHSALKKPPWNEVSDPPVPGKPTLQQKITGDSSTRAECHLPSAIVFVDDLTTLWINFLVEPFLGHQIRVNWVHPSLFLVWKRRRFKTTNHSEDNILLLTRLLSEHRKPQSENWKLKIESSCEWATTLKFHGQDAILPLLPSAQRSQARKLPSSSYCGYCIF